MLKYLEKYMRKVKGLKLSYDFVRDQLVNEKPLKFAKNMIHEESFGHDEDYHSNKNREYDEYIDNLIDSHIDL